MIRQILALATMAVLANAIQAEDNTLSPQECKDGWILLFDGKTLEGWMTSAEKPSHRPVEDGCINPHQCGHYMMVPKKRYENFILALDFKLSKGCNSGIFVRTSTLVPRPGKDVGFNGIEIQLLDSTTADFHDTGAIYDLVKPTKNAMKPVGEWNHLTITCDKNIIEVELNGEKVNHMNLDEWILPNSARRLRPQVRHRLQRSSAQGLYRPAGSRRGLLVQEHKTEVVEVASGVVSSPAAALTEGVLKAMSLKKFKIALAALLMIVLVGSGVGPLAYQRLAAGQVPVAAEEAVQQEKPKQLTGNNTITVKHLEVEAVDASRNTISVVSLKHGYRLQLEGAQIMQLQLDGGLQGVLKLETADDAKGKPGAGKEGQTKPAEGKGAESGKDSPAKGDVQKVEKVKVRGQIIGLQNGQGVITMQIVGESPEKPTKMEDLALAKDARILIKTKPGKLSDIKKGMRVTLELGTNEGRLVVRGIKAE